MRQEYKDEATTLVRRMAEQAKAGRGIAYLNLRRQLEDLVDQIARNLPEGPAGEDPSWIPPYVRINERNPTL